MEEQRYADLVEARVKPECREQLIEIAMRRKSAALRLGELITAINDQAGAEFSRIVETKHWTQYIGSAWNKFMEAMGRAPAELKMLFVVVADEMKLYELPARELKCFGEDQKHG